MANDNITVQDLNQDEYYEIEEIETGRTKEAAKKLAVLRKERDEAKARLIELETNLKEAEQQAQKRKKRTRKLIKIGAGLLAKAKKDWEDFDLEQWWKQQEEVKQNAIEAAIENAAKETEAAVECAVHDYKSRWEVIEDTARLIATSEDDILDILKQKPVLRAINEEYKRRESKAVVGQTEQTRPC